MRATGKGEAVAGEPWIKREQRSIWLALVVVDFGSGGDRLPRRMVARAARFSGAN
jgi:hypothetical protein